MTWLQTTLPLPCVSILTLCRGAPCCSGRTAVSLNIRHHHNLTLTTEWDKVNPYPNVSVHRCLLDNIDLLVHHFQPVCFVFVFSTAPRVLPLATLKSFMICNHVLHGTQSTSLHYFNCFNFTPSSLSLPDFSSVALSRKLLAVVKYEYHALLLWAKESKSLN